MQTICISLQWRHNECDGVSNHQCPDRLLNRLFRRRSKNTSKLRVTCLREGNPPVTGGFPSQKACNAEYISIWWRHRVYPFSMLGCWELKYFLMECKEPLIISMDLCKKKKTQERWQWSCVFLELTFRYVIDIKTADDPDDTEVRVLTDTVLT